MHFDQQKTIGALGLLIAAKWYRSTHPQHLLISLDSNDARRWMNLEEDARRADLLGLWVENQRPVLDILEIKSSEDARDVYRLSADGILSGKPVEQLINTGRSVEAIFGLNELHNHILTPPRREILRGHLYHQGFSGERPAQEKQYWVTLLNGLFKGELKPEIRLHLIVVNLGVSQEPVDQTFKAEGGSVRLLHLNEHAVNLQLGSRGAPAIPPPVDQASGTVHEAEMAEKYLEPAVNPQAPLQPIARDLSDTIETTCRGLRAACQDFGIRVSEISSKEVDVGPSVLRYKIKLAPGEQGEKLKKQAENIAHQLAANSVPIIEFLRGTEYMYLDLGRPDREIVFLEPLLIDVRPNNINELPLHIGVSPAGKAYQLDLGDDRLPHLLVAGGTGSGKTIFLYSVVLSLIAAHRSKTLELMIIDPKQTDFTVFKKLPQLRDGTVINEAERGVEALREIAEVDMKERSTLLQDAHCRDIKSYNASRPKELMRPLVIVIDEYADLVTGLPKRDRDQFDRVISRLAARGRNVGIHLVVATQRPTVDVVTGNIKANMPCRISFSLPSSRDSQVILDDPGAERLLRNGDMLLLLEGELCRLQGYFVEPKNIENLIRKYTRK